MLGSLLAWVLGIVILYTMINLLMLKARRKIFRPGMNQQPIIIQLPSNQNYPQNFEEREKGSVVSWCVFAIFVVVLLILFSRA